VTGGNERGGWGGLRLRCCAGWEWKGRSRRLRRRVLGRASLSRSSGRVHFSRLCGPYRATGAICRTATATGTGLPGLLLTAHVGFEELPRMYDSNHSPTD
jgi:hypothetical protein